MKPSVSAALFLCAISALPCAGLLEAQAPAFDTSGNHFLSGNYYFRQVIYEITTTADTQGIAGDIGGAITVYGNISFDGNGNYTIAGGTSGLVLNSSVGATIPLSCYLAGTSCTSGSPVAGTYAISASGYGYITSPVAAGDLIQGLVGANGVFIASTTETNFSYSDLMIATPLTGATPTNATFNGTYTVAAYSPGGSPLNSEDAFFELTADGNGNLGTVNINGFTTSNSGTAFPISQTNSGVKYFFSGGAGVITFPTSNTANFYSGQEYLYFSPDGSFFVGGSPQGFDIMIGVRNGSGAQNFAGTYYEAGIDQDLSGLQSTSAVNFDGYYGSFNTTPAGQIVAADRLNSPFNATAFGSSYTDTFSPPVTGTYTDTASQFQYTVGANGAVRVGAGIWPFLSISVALQAPTFTPTTPVYINPTGIVNAASFAPFTAGIAPGEFLTIYGTNLAPGTVVASSVPYPTILGRVQVLVNGVAAPLYFVSTGQVAFIMPAGYPYNLAQIQVINGSLASNIVTMPVNKTVPGIYTIPSGGIGNAAVVDTNTGKIVTSSTPAAPGDIIEVFATGLGSAFPTVADGAAPPVSPLSNTTNTITAEVGGTAATVYFAGLAPTLAGLYQVNLQIPTTLAAGIYTLDLSGPDSFTSESTIAVGTAASTAADRQPVASARKHSHVNAAAKRSPLCVGPSGCKGSLPGQLR
jgi:uncharacterized protein (TIGR03437 family)